MNRYKEEKVMKMLILPTFLLSMMIACDNQTQFSPNQNSFVFIASRTQSEKKCDGKECRVKVTTGSGSGIVIASDPKSTLVMTAGHVCKMPAGETHMLSAIDSKGNVHQSVSFKLSDKPDLCIINTSGIWGAPVQISDSEPAYGERVTSMAAPEGVFEPNMVLIFDGRYAGKALNEDSIFTMPCAPGSSGSAVLNQDGKIVSIVHSAAKNFQNIAIGSDIDDIKKFISEN
jgi:hypothetical protein